MKLKFNMHDLKHLWGGYYQMKREIYFLPVREENVFRKFT